MLSGFFSKCILIGSLLSTVRRRRVQRLILKSMKMSFPKAQIKRFNDAAGCAPPVGAYDPKDGKKAAGGVIEKSDRFKLPKVTGDNMSSMLSCSNPNLCSTPIKGCAALSLSKINSSSSESLASNKSTKSTTKKPVQAGEHLSKIKELEQEIRRLLHEKGDKDKELNRLRQDHERLEGRLSVANAERSASMARSAQLEQEARDAKRGLDVLQKQVTSAESNGRKKDERLREEVQRLQSQIHSKEQEIQHTQHQIAQAMLALISDVQQCAAHSDRLSPLFSRLELSADMTESEDDDKLVASETGIKQFDSQIRKARHDIRRVSRTIWPLAESGAERVDMLEARLEEDHQHHLQVLTQQLTDTQTHSVELSTTIDQKELQCATFRAQIEQLEMACECRRQELERALGEKNSVEQQLRAEHEAVLDEQHALVMKEREQLQDQLQAALEDRMQKDARLGELHSCLMEKQEEYEVATATLKDQLSSLQCEMSKAQHDLQHKQELLQQLQEELQDSQECRAKLQDQLQLLQEEERQLRESRDGLQMAKEMTEKELEVKKTLLTEAMQALKGEVASERKAGTKTTQVLFEEMAEKAALEERIYQLEQENATLDASIRSLTAKFQASIQDLELALGEEKQKVGQMSAWISALEEEQGTTRQELNQTQTVNKDLVNSLSSARDEVSSLRSASQDLKEQLQQEREAKLTLQTDVQDMRLQLEEEKAAVVSLRSSLADTEQLRQAAIREGQERVEEERGIIIDLQAQLKALQITVDDRECAAQRILHEASERAEQLQVENKQHHIANAALKDQLTQLTDQHSKELQQLQHKCHSLTQDRQRLIEKHQDDLESVRKAVALDRQANDLQMDELNMKLDRAQAFNTQLKEEMKKLLKDNEKLKDDRKAEVTTLEVKVEAAEAKAAEVSGQLDLLRHQAKHAQAECLRLKSCVEEAQGEVRVKGDEVGELRSRLEECHSTMAANEDRIEELMAEKEALEDHLNRLSEEHTVLDSDLERQLETVRAAALEEREDYEKIISEMSEKIQQLETQLENMPAPDEDDEDWQQKYEDLFARVEPFLEQLDAYAAEKNHLLGRNQLAEAEMSRVMDKYAKLLGHQNQKQKIQYISKLKDEYMQCRKEKEALKEKCNKQQLALQKLEKKIQTMEGRKTFDPSQAFKHSSKKEDFAPINPVVPAQAPAKAFMPSLAASAARQVDRKGVRGQEEMVTRSPLKQTNK